MMRLTKKAISAAAYLGHMAAKNPALLTMAFNSIRLNRAETERFRQSDELRFLAYVFAKRHTSQSQILQDLWVCYELNEKRGGFFVEFGATDGLTNSNSWLLEKAYGWSGVLAEPNPVWRPDLLRNRSARIDLRCVHAQSGRTVSFMATDNSDPELSCIAEFSRMDHFASVRAKGAELLVETVSLNDLLAEHQAPAEIDYMTVDTEGSEYVILAEFDFKRYRPQLLSVEQNRTTEPLIQQLLERHGYVRVFHGFSQWDGWYVLGDRRGETRGLELDRALAESAPPQLAEALAS
jgi:FkbM family methyltransferase